MRLIIIPYDENFEIKENEIIEIETISEDQINRTLLSLMEGKYYTVEIYKNINDLCVFNIGANEGRILLFENREQFELKVGSDIFDVSIDTIKKYIKPEGHKFVKHLITTQNEIHELIKKERNEEWKKNYTVKSKIESKRNTIKSVSMVVIIIIFLTALYLFWVDELRFIGRENIEKKGVITKATFHHIGSGYYMQTVLYKFEHNNLEYFGEFEAGKRIGKQFEGDSILIKFRKSDPKVSKYIRTTYE